MRSGVPTLPLDRSRVVILGSGPTGLGAAKRLHELGHTNFAVYEKENHVGGLAASFRDDQGFIWDIGGHIQFSHYKYFDNTMDEVLSDEWLHHERESWIWMQDTFIPYPFQNNIRHLRREEMLDCLKGLIHVATKSNGDSPVNFEQWIQASFGSGIARHFLLPYNFKVWAFPPKDMAYQWVGERVAKVDLERVVMNILTEKDDAGWGPNSTFRYPVHGGTGEIWRRLAQRIPTGRIHHRKEVVGVDVHKKVVRFSDGTATDYDILISTIPLNILAERAALEQSLQCAARHLRFSTVHVVGIGLRGAPPPHLKTKCWMYFPEDSAPFYRATVLSNYSPNVVPDPANQWSLMVEVSQSPVKPLPGVGLQESVINGLLATRLIESRNDIVSFWHHVAGHGYPTPTLERDQALNALLPALEEFDIYSRGRFGAWKYEVSNQDHSLMQGVEVINRLAGIGEEETVWNPALVNNRPKE